MKRNADYTGFGAVDALCIVAQEICAACNHALACERTRVQDKPNSIARVNALFAGGIASSSVSASPRGQRSSGQSQREQLRQSVRERDARVAVDPPPRGVAGEHRAVAQRVAPALD